MATHTTLHRVCEVLVVWLRSGVATDPPLHEAEWPVLVRAASVHGVGPRLAALLHGARWVPLEVGTWADREAELNARRVRRLVAEGARILEAAAARGLEVLPLKGLALAGHLPSLEHRPMADVDVLVRPDQAAAVHEVLLELGYRRDSSKVKHDEYILPPGRVVVSMEHEHPDNPRPVEVHTRCGESFARSSVDLTETIWSDVEKATIDGIAATIPSLTAVFTHLVVHAAWQWWFGGGRLAQLLDLAELLSWVGDPAAALHEVDPRYALLALVPTERLLPGRLPPGMLDDFARRAGPAAQGLAGDLDPVNSSHLMSSGRSRLLRILRLHRDHPRDLARGLGYVFAPGIGEMLINHDRIPEGPARFASYPILWCWHLANMTIRA
jgi:hypothetical protein